MPESVKDRPTKSHEYVFLLTKSEIYYYDSDAVKEQAATGTGKRNKRTVWTVPTKPYRDAHFATFPEALVEPCILAGCPAGGVVLDPFFGAGTTGVVAKKLGRCFIGIDLNPEYCKIAEKRIGEVMNESDNYGRCTISDTAASTREY